MEWKTIKKKLFELKPHEHNPRIMTEKQDADLRKSLDKFSLAEIPVINLDGTIIAGHQRIRILKESDETQEIDVRVPTKKLTEEEVKEYLIRSNKNTGQFDFDVLANEFDIDDLKDWGFDDLPDLKIDVDDIEEEKQAQEEKFIVEVTLSNDMECDDLYDDLISKGYLAKKK